MASVRPLADLEATPHATVFPNREPRTIRLELEAGEEIPRHAHPDREIVLYVLEGRLELRLDTENYELQADDIARFDGDQGISPRAIEDSSALLVLATRADEG